jgi:glycosyltransferase involved in cell wall biosynthesis
VRVLVLTADYPPDAWSGIAAAVHRQVGALERLGVEVTVATPDPSGRRRRAAPPGRVLDLCGSRFPGDPRGYDVVHLHSLALSPLALAISARYGTALVYTAHARMEAELPPGPARAFWSDVQDRTMRASRRVVFPSAAERSGAVRRLGALASRSIVVPNPVRLRPAPRRRGHSRGPLVFAGRFATAKGLDLLAVAAPRVLAAYDGYFVLAGGHGDARGAHAVRTLVRNCGGRCRVAGWLPGPALVRLLAGASLLLVPSAYEPFGLVALDAMSLGTPVLAAAVGGLAELVLPGSGGRLVERADPRDWADAITALACDDAARRRLAEQGPPDAWRRFAPEAVGARLIEDAYAA